MGIAFKWLVPDAPWADAFALGAIVSPPDAVAATAVLRRFRFPRRIVTLLEGESLVNDATGLVRLEREIDLAEAWLASATPIASARIDSGGRISTTATYSFLPLTGRSRAVSTG